MVSSSSLEFALEAYGQFIKLAHTFAGLYLWEYFTTLDFEWGVYTGKRPWRWSFLAYIATRTLSFINIVSALVGYNLTTEFNCELWLRCNLVTGWFGGCAASLLLVFRGISIWGRDCRIVAITCSLLVVDLVSSGFAATMGHAQFSPLIQTCEVTGTNLFKWPVMVVFITDISLLSIVIGGLLYKRAETHLWNMLYFQGLFWIVASFLVGMPDTILPFLNINAPMNMMFLYPQMVVMVIASSRAYRELYQYVIEENERPSRSRPSQKQSGSTAHRVGPIPPRRSRNRMDVQVSVSQTIEFDVTHPRYEGSPRVLPSRMGDEESGFSSTGGLVPEGENFVVQTPEAPAWKTQNEETI